eukprot:6212098-Pleurochrysis_carterae.AAC.2
MLTLVHCFFCVLCIACYPCTLHAKTAANTAGPRAACVLRSLALAPWTLFPLIAARALCCRMRSVRSHTTHRAPCALMPQRKSPLTLAPWTLVALTVARALCCRTRSVRLHARHRASCALMPRRASHSPCGHYLR